MTWNLRSSATGTRRHLSAPTPRGKVASGQAVSRHLPQGPGEAQRRVLDGGRRQRGQRRRPPRGTRLRRRRPRGRRVLDRVPGRQTLRVETCADTRHYHYRERVGSIRGARPKARDANRSFGIRGSSSPAGCTVTRTAATGCGSVPRPSRALHLTTKQHPSVSAFVRWPVLSDERTIPNRQRA